MNVTDSLLNRANRLSPADYHLWRYMLDPALVAKPHERWTAADNASAELELNKVTRYAEYRSLEATT